VLFTKHRVVIDALSKAHRMAIWMP